MEKNISGCEVKKFTRSPHLIIHLKDYTDYMESLSGFKKRMVEVKVKDLGTPIALNLDLVDYDQTEIVSYIEHGLRISNLETTKE